ncbi:MAG: hypothetical protein ABEJ24_01460 [Candidatus Magasanikbacteria bacterium]
MSPPNRGDNNRDPGKLGDENSVNNPEQEPGEEFLDPNQKPERYYGEPGSLSEKLELIDKVILRRDADLLVEEDLMTDDQLMEYLVLVEGEQSEQIVRMIRSFNVLVEDFTSQDEDPFSVEGIRKIANRTGLDRPSFFTKIAKAYFHMGQFDPSFFLTSERLTKAVLDLKEGEISPIEKADAVETLGSIQDKFGDQASAYKLKESGLQVLNHSDMQDVNQAWLKAKCLHGMADYQIDDERVPNEKIEDRFEEVEQILRDIQDEAHVARTKLDIAKFHIQNEDYKKAHQYASQAYEELHETGYIRKLPDAAEIMRDSQEQLSSDAQIVRRIEQIQTQDREAIQPKREDLVELKETEEKLKPARVLLKLPSSSGETVYFVKKDSDGSYELPEIEGLESGEGFSKFEMLKNLERMLAENLSESEDAELEKITSNHPVIPTGEEKRSEDREVQLYKIDLTSGPQDKIPEVKPGELEKKEKFCYVAMKYEELKSNQENFDSESQKLIEGEIEYQGE